MTALGDVALGVGPQFVRFLPTIMPVLNVMQRVAFQGDTDVETELRASLLETYSGIIQGREMNVLCSAGGINFPF